MHDSRPSERPASTAARLGATAAALAVLLPAAAGAQLTTDQVPFQRTVPEDVEIKGEYDGARLRLGPVRVLPWVSVHNLGYNNNVNGSPTDPVGDYTASVGAGARLYLPIGSKTYLRADALPEYTWYKDQTERNQWGGRGELAYLAFFNHMSLRLSGAYVVNANSILTSEIPAVVTRTGWDGQAHVEVDVTSRISAFAGFEVLRQRVKDPTAELIGEVDIAYYNRTDGVVRGGLRYKFAPGWDVSIAGEATQTRFVQTPDLRNNKGYAPLFGLHYDRPRLFVNLYAGYRFGRADQGSSFPSFETPTGSAFASYTILKNLDVQAFWSRRLTYGTSVVNPYYVENRYGGGLSVHFLSRFVISGSASLGSDDYGLATKGTGLPARFDDVTVYAGSLAVTLWRNVALTAQASRTSYDSNAHSNDRSVFVFLTGLSFGLGFAR